MSVKQIIKYKHKELKTKVNEVENTRYIDRSSISWFSLRELKKLKLKAKDKLNDFKQKFHS
tara:strand:- start:532 stop:714 length:183 start_codon:yes stop_codon:yes gene_type:complete